jgi:hypothetical protein
MPTCAAMAIIELFQGSLKGYDAQEGLLYSHAERLVDEQDQVGTECAARTDARLGGGCLTPMGTAAPRLSGGLTRANEFCLRCLTSSFPAPVQAVAAAPPPVPPPPPPQQQPFQQQPPQPPLPQQQPAHVPPPPPVHARKRSRRSDS